MRLLAAMSCSLLLVVMCQAQMETSSGRFPDGYFIQAKREVDRSLATLKSALRNKDTSALQPTHKKTFKTLDSLYSVFFEQHTAESLQNVESKIASVSLDNDVLLDVKFTTKRGGAIIKYISVKDETPTACVQTENNCVAKLPIGKCAFWSERNGKRTSDVYLKTFDESRMCEIVEDEDKK